MHMPSRVWTTFQPQFRPATQRDAEVFLTWRYPEPFGSYNPQPADLFAFCDPVNQYYTILKGQEQIIGYCCLGAEARVSGGVYHLEDALDVGMALCPTLVHTGLGVPMFRAVLQFASETMHPPLPFFRTTITAWNRSSQRICQKFGFQQVRTFLGKTPTGAHQFVQMLRPKTHLEMS